jgi:GxxExxY protein
MTLLFEKESYEIRGACFEVFNKIGGGIREKTIENALKKELELRNLKVSTQERINIFYKEEKIGVYIPDLVVDDSILIELKSKPYITREDKKQFFGYLKGSKYTLGFLINFSQKKLEIKRFIYTTQSA